jgi:putative DNA primase/helicase
MMPNTIHSPVITDMKTYLKRNERGDAELLAKLFVDQILFDHTEKAWYLWRGAYWEPDRTGEVFSKLDVIASEYLAAASEERKKGNIDLSEEFARRSGALLNNNRMKSILDVASRLPEFAFSGDQWDTNPMILPVANGIIDLCSGKLYTSEPQNYIRTFCPVDWKGLNEPAPLWEKTLFEIFKSDTELIAFISRFFGYCVTGETKEQKLPIFWGEGSNGKGVIMDTILSVLGSGFCFNVQSEVLMELRQGDPNGAKPFVVSLRGKRLVFASETKEGQKLNTGLVKQLTGDGYMTARTLHEKPITFRQTHKIILITNHLPVIPDAGDYAIWRRVFRVPFTVSFKENPQTLDERPLDKDLLKKLEP